MITYGGGWLWGIDHCYDPITNHLDAVQAYSITFGNNKDVYFGDDKYYYWENRCSKMDEVRNEKNRVK